MSEKLDLEEFSRALFQRGNLSIEPEEHEDERNARLRRLSWDLLLSHCVNGAIVLALIAAGIFSGVLSVSPDQATAEWGRGLFTAILAGAVGFFTGREVGRRI